MDDTPETDAATLTELYQVRELGFEVTHVDFARSLERQRNESLQLARELRCALVSIEEYWNRDQNEAAMADACWHAINTSQEAIEKANQLLK